LKNLVLLLAMIFAGQVTAEVPPEQQQEVDHLINFIKTTSCLFIRNGKPHDGASALAHIQKKYDYFRRKINSTEQFIDYSATKSTMSGKYYMVKCNDQAPIKSKDWLIRELEKYRDGNGT